MTKPTINQKKMWSVGEFMQMQTDREEAVKEQQLSLDKILDSIPEQVGGNHYGKLKIDPNTYAMENELNFMQGQIIKYVTRYDLKNGLEDLKKAMHNLEILIEMEYGSEEK